MNKVYCYCYHPCTTIVPFLSAEKASSCTFGILTELLGKTAISTRSLGFKTLPIDIFSGTLRAVENQCLEFASVVDWYCSCRLLRRVAVVCCVGHFEPELEGSVRRVLRSRDVNRVSRCESTNLSTSSAMSTFSPVGLRSSNGVRMCVS